MVTVREATAYNLMVAIAKDHNQEQYVVKNTDEFINSSSGDAPPFEVLLAEFEGEVAGYCSYTWLYSMGLELSFMNIDDLFVWKKFSGRQISEALMVKAKEVCLTKNASGIRWDVA